MAKQAGQAKKGNKGKKNRKFDRHSRAPSNRMQEFRTARNKTRRIERDKKEKDKSAKRKAAKKIVRGATRKTRRWGMSRKSKPAAAPTLQFITFNGQSLFELLKQQFLEQ